MSKPPVREAPTSPHLLQSTAVYTAADVQRLLRLKPSTLRREIRLGRLRVSRRAGKYWFLGSWLLAWIEAGEVRLPRQDSDTV